MSRRISPAWWPLLLVASPVAVPALAWRSHVFALDAKRASDENASRIGAARAVDMPELDWVEIAILADWRAKKGFRGEPGVSCLFRTPLGSLLLDVSFGDETGVVAHNAAQMGVTSADVDAIAISHLHNDHMGGTRAFRSRALAVPAALRPSRPVPCFLPASASAEGFDARVVAGPQILAAGIASTGPLARRLFFLGWVEEQALVVRLKGKGLVVFTGCGHPTLATILRMVRKMSSDPIYAIGGGLHLPLTGGRLRVPGIDLQTIVGTGKPPWRRIDRTDVEATAAAIREAGAKRLLLSAHDACDEALCLLSRAIDGRVEVVEAGGVYRL